MNHLVQRVFLFGNLNLLCLKIFFGLCIYYQFLLVPGKPVELRKIDQYENLNLENLCTPVKVEELQRLLTVTQYPEWERDFLIQGFQTGFSLEYRGLMDRKDTSKNIPFTPGIGDRIEMWNKIMKEVKLGRFAGPFEKIPFEFYIQSPIGLVPKAEGQTRLIFHLSYDFPNGNRSINHWTPKELCSVQYNDLDHAISNCIWNMKSGKRWELEENRKNSQCGSHEGQGHSEVFKVIYFGKTDIKSAFRQVPLKRTMWPLLILKATNPSNGQVCYSVDKCLPLGASISCSHFQKFSNALKHIVEVLERKYNSLTNYLDDFLFLHFLRQECEKFMNRFMSVCEQINLPIAVEKTELPMEWMIFLGMLLNGRSCTLMIPEEKRNKALHLLGKACDKRKLKVKEIESLTGLLNFLCRSVRPGRVFTRRLYASIDRKMDANPKLKQHHHVSLNREFRNDCEVWATFLANQSAVNKPFTDFDEEIEARDIGFYTDSSKGPEMGFGCYFNKEWAFGQWEKDFIKEMDPSIAYLELYALCVGIFIWSDKLKNIKVLLHCDNIGVVEMVNKMSSKCKNCMYLLRLLMVQNLLDNRIIKVKYIKSKDNYLSDALSRQKVDLFLKKALPGTKILPEKLPEEIWPLSRIFQK